MGIAISNAKPEALPLFFMVTGFLDSTVYLLHSFIGAIFGLGVTSIVNLLSEISTMGLMFFQMIWWFAIRTIQ
ncbi:hypothetical protein F4782DRAFT_477267 [Xylaria castorea]|nr:hypothetical protein F4782DRAFT_477267 [Xylaria castorea]